MSKYIKLVVVLTILMLLFSECSEKEVPSINEYEHLENKFYTHYSYVYTYTTISSSFNHGQVIETRVENDSLKVLDYAFPISSASQSYFEVEDNSSIPEVTVVQTLSFFNDFDSLVIRETESGGSASVVINMTGAKTNLDVSVLPHAYATDINGSYLLNIQNKEVQGGTTIVDSQYVALSNVVCLDYRLSINNKDFSTDLYHSYTNFYLNDMNQGVKQRDRLYCTADSLFLDYQLIQTTQQDTIHNIYVGVKQ